MSARLAAPHSRTPRSPANHRPCFIRISSLSMASPVGRRPLIWRRQKPCSTARGLGRLPEAGPEPSRECRAPEELSFCCTWTGISRARAASTTTEGAVVHDLRRRGRHPTSTEPPKRSRRSGYGGGRIPALWIQMAAHLLESVEDLGRAEGPGRGPTLSAVGRRS